MTFESKPSNVRLPVPLKRRIETLARMNNISASDVIRLTLHNYIPELEAGRFHLVAAGSDRTQPKGVRA